MNETPKSIHRATLIITLLLIALLAYKITQAQDYNDYLVSVNGAYMRVENLPVRVCASEDSAAIAEAVRQMSVAVPSLYVADNCDVQIVVVEDAPCLRDDGSHARACTNGWNPARIQIRRNALSVAILLHELTHAYGVRVHVRGQPSVVNYYVADGQVWLTPFDIDLLNYLYSQPAYIQARDAEIIQQQDDAYCAWVEAHLLTHELAHEYRCGDLERED